MKMLETPDGKRHGYADFGSLYHLIGEYAGYDTAEAVAEIENANTYEETKANTDFEACEGENEAYRFAMMEIDDLADELEELLDASRLNRKKLMDLRHRIKKVVMV